MDGVGRRHRVPVSVAAVLLWSSACQYHVYSPPARGLPLETPATLPSQRTGAQVEAGNSGALFGPELLVAGGRVRRSLATRLDGSIEAGVIRVVKKSDTQTHRNIYTLRAGAKLQPSFKHVAFTFGLGTGASAAGAFVSPELGVLLAYENRYVVPTIGVRGFLSQPLFPSRVDLGGGDDGMRYSDSPRTTWGGALLLGVRVPVQYHVDAPHSILLGVTWTGVGDHEKHETFFGFGAGFELVL